jgi:hypothetical protein
VTPDEATALIADATASWVEDPASSAVWSGTHEGRLGCRLAQTSRDFTTMWFDVGDLTVATEAYLLPAPRHDHAEVYRQALRRNHDAWPAYIAMDATGGLYVRTRTSLATYTEQQLEEAVGATYALVDLAFPGLVAAGFARREKTT